MKQFGKLLRLNADDLLLCGGAVGGLFLLLQVVISCVMAFLKPDTSLLLSGVVLPVVAGFIAFIVTLTHVGVTFIQALKFGQTRRRALWLTLGLTGFEAVFSFALAGLLALAERLFAPTLWLILSGRGQVVWDTGGARSPVPEGGLSAAQDTVRSALLFIEDFSLAWWWYPAIALGCVALGLICGALIQRFGSRGGWVLWAAWMLFFLIYQLLPWKQFTIIDWLFPLLGAAALAALAWSFWSLLHAVVKT